MTEIILQLITNTQLCPLVMNGLSFGWVYFHKRHHKWFFVVFFHILMKIISANQIHVAPDVMPHFYGVTSKATGLNRQVIIHLSHSTRNAFFCISNWVRLKSATKTRLQGHKTFFSFSSKLSMMFILLMIKLLEI